MSDLFSFKNNKKSKEELNYTAKDIEVLEGLEPVRRRPGMYIGGTDEAAMHHLVSEVLDNAMDEAVAGFASIISIKLQQDNLITISDNGRGIPVDDHPKFPGKSALEVILTTLHSGGKFSDKVYQTSGGLHGVGISVVNALASMLEVKVFRSGKIFKQSYSKGHPVTPLLSEDAPKKLKGSSISFTPDLDIFDDQAKFRADKIYELAKSKAYLHRGLEIEWECDESLIKDAKTPPKATLCFPSGLKDYLLSKVSAEELIGGVVFAGMTNSSKDQIKLEWAVGWSDKENFVQSYCNTIYTPLGGTHEQGFKSAILRSFRVYGEMIGNKKTQHIIIEDILESACIVFSIFQKDPSFQGQTKEKLVSPGISKPVENIVKDHFDHWLSSNRGAASILLDHIIETAETRLQRKSEKNVSRKTATQKLRLPGKLTDCSRQTAQGTELFIVEGESAGGSAKQARDRETQAILPLRGKILNVANATLEKISQNQEITDLEIALACGSLNNFKEDNLRYERVIIMTDADVDGSHIASLLMTFFYLRMPKLIETGHLFLARPPLYRLTQSNKTHYAAGDKQKDDMIKKLTQASKAKIDVGRFKGLGEMTASQLKETTMNPKNRTLIQVTVCDFKNIDKLVNNLMGKKAEERFKFIQTEALLKMNNIIDKLDV